MAISTFWIRGRMSSEFAGPDPHDAVFSVKLTGLADKSARAAHFAVRPPQLGASSAKFGTWRA